MPSVAKRSGDDRDALALFHETHSKTCKRLKLNDELCDNAGANHLDDQKWMMETDLSSNSERPFDGLPQTIQSPMQIGVAQPHRSKTQTMTVATVCSRCLAGEPGHIKHALLR